MHCTRDGLWKSDSCRGSPVWEPPLYSACPFLFTIVIQGERVHLVGPRAGLRIVENGSGRTSEDRPGGAQRGLCRVTAADQESQEFRGNSCSSREGRGGNQGSLHRGGDTLAGS